jgi:hypothetical protein
MFGEGKREANMRKIILTIVGAALIAGSTTHVAFSKERRHVRSAHHLNSERFRNAKAYAVPSVPRQPVPSYTGSMGGWGSMTGFN